MELDRYRTIKGEAAAKLTRRGSRFIGIAYPVESLEEVKRRLAEAGRRYRDATHRCYAYRLLTESGIVAHSDDGGEPARSAGPPILRVIEGQDLLNILVIVVRYFGGTKLGIGGL
ncbi:MAG: IMPACT family protein, partial [Candidatus Bipolaricaulia bacterium]